MSQKNSHQVQKNISSYQKGINTAHDKRDFLPAEVFSLPPTVYCVAAAKAKQDWLTSQLEPPQSSKGKEIQESNLH